MLGYDEELDLIRLLVGVAILFYASYTDLKSRKVSNMAWILMGAIGATIVAISFELSTLIPILLMVIIAFLLNYLNIFGGADTKALISISILAPSWPHFGSMPSYPSIIFFPLVIFMNSILLFLAFPIYFCFYNLMKKDFEFPYCFFGYKMDSKKAMDKFVWPMEKIEDGKRIKKIFPVKSQKLKEFEGKIWVTSKVPFMLPLLIGFIISFVMGDLLYMIISSII